MGTCCTRNDAVPPIGNRNTDNKIDSGLQPLLDTSEKKHNAMRMGEGEEVELETSTIIGYILDITSFDLIDAWKKIDIHNKEEINIDRELHVLFLRFIDRYIEKQTGRKTEETQYYERANALSQELAKHFKSILMNYNYEEGDIMTQEFYLENLQQYLAEPNPDLDLSRTREEQMDDEIDFNKQEVDVLADGRDVQPIVSSVPTEEIAEMFDMLSFISTSGTIRDDGNFNVDVTVQSLRSALEAPKKKRGEKVGEILASLTESQRIAVRNSFVGSKSESLQSALEDNFSGDLLLVLTELCRSCAYNDAEWIEKSRNKLNINTSVINEILMSRTNCQLEAIKGAYKERYNGRNLLDSLLQSFNDTGSYGSLLKLVLTDNNKILRKEFNPKHLKEKKIRDDAKILYHILENTKGKLNKLKIIEMLCHRSWFHIAILCKEYGKKSKYDLKTMIERKFGKNSKSGDALQKIIDVSRNRHSYFAQLLFQSMKGMSTDDAMLIRIIVGRSGIDLGEIAAQFSQKYGSGKTLLQFIKANARRGTYRNILLRICAIGSNKMLDDLDDDDDRLEFSKSNQSTVIGGGSSGNIFAYDDDCKVLESHHSFSLSRSTIDGDDGKERDRSIGPRQTWEEYISSAPTIISQLNFDAYQEAEDLILVLNDKKKKKEAKKLLIQTLTKLSNRQRQELKKAFVESHPRAQELKDATQDTLRKGKTMIVMLGLLQRPAEFNCFWIKQALKNKDIKLLAEVLCSCSNYEITKMRAFYEKTEKSELLKDIDRHIIGNKKTAHYLISQILKGQRPEQISPDKKLCKIHLSEIKNLLKKKNQKECKQFFGKLFVENSYSQIKYEINKFNTASEHTLTSVVKKIMGTGHSGLILENIIKISTNRFGFFAEKLRESMKGITTSEHILIRILIGRSEKDLGDIVQYFAEENYGEGKTLKQWMETSLKGSFKTALLRIAGIADFADDDGNESKEWDSVTETDHSSTGNEAMIKKPGVATAVLLNSKSHGFPISPKENSKSKENSQYESSYQSTNQLQQSPDPPSTTTNQSPQPPVSSPKIIISTPSEVLNEAKLAKQDGGGDIDEDEKQKEEAVHVYDPYDINEEEFGRFIIEKVNDKTAQRLMQHLKQGSKGDVTAANDDKEEDVIKASQCIHVLLFACVLFLKFKEKTEKRPEVQIDKKKLKKSLMPSFNWIKENKLQKGNGTLQKSKYKILGKWLKEYYQTK